MFEWLRKRKKQETASIKPKIRRSRSGYLPMVEALEDRVVPTLTFVPVSSPFMVVEGSLATFTGSYSDTNLNANNVVFSTSLGSITKTGTISGTYTWSFTPTTTESVSVSISATDGSLLGYIPVIDGFTLSVSDAPLSNTTPTQTYNAVVANSTGTLIAGTFNDGNPYATLSQYSSCTIYWGDGSSSTGTIQFVSSNTSSSSWEVTGSHIYNAEGSDNVSVNLNDGGGSYLTMTGTTVAVASALTDAAASHTYSEVEGNPTGTQVVGTFTDQNPNASANDFPNSNLVISWGDGTTSNGTIQLVSSGGGTSTWNVLGSHTYLAGGTYTPSVAVTSDLLGSSLAGTSGTTFNVAAASFINDGSARNDNVIEGSSTGTQIIGTFIDNDPLSVASDFPGADLVITWGDNGPTSTGTIQLLSSSSVNTIWNVLGSHTYADEGTYLPSVAISDTEGSSLASTSGTTFNVADAPINDAAVSRSESAVLGNSSSLIAGTFIDHNPLASASDFPSANLVITWGDGTPTSTGTIQFVSSNATTSTWNVLGTHAYAALGAYQPSVAVADTGGESLKSTSGTTINVGSALADAAATHAYSDIEGNSTGTQVVGTFIDSHPAAVAGNFPSANLVITWGDGTATSTGTIQFVSSNATTSTWNVLGSHTYAAAGTYHPSVAVKDTTGSTLAGTSGTTFSVTHAPLTDTTTASTRSVAVLASSGMIVLATFSDANPSALASSFPSANLVINWGDGTTSLGTLQLVSRTATASNWEVLGSHTYKQTSAGVTYTIQVSIKDVDGMSTSTKKSKLLVQTQQRRGW